MIAPGWPRPSTRPRGSIRCDRSGWSSRSRPVSVVAASRSPRSPTPRATSRRSRGLSWPACGPISRRSRTRRSRLPRSSAYDAAVEAIRSGRDRRSRGATWPPARHSSPVACWPTTACARAGDLRPRPRRAGRRRTAGEPAAAAPGHGAHRAARPRRGPAGRLGHQLRADVPDGPARAGSRRCPSATAMAGHGRSRTGPGAIVRGVPGPAGRATSRWTRSWPTSPTCPDRRSTPMTSSCCSGSSGDERITRRGPGAGAHHELVGNRDRHVPPSSSGVPCRGGAGRSADAHRAERVAWRASSSGTETSATWRSTPS